MVVYCLVISIDCPWENGHKMTISMLLDIKPDDMQRLEFITGTTNTLKDIDPPSPTEQRLHSSGHCVVTNTYHAISAT